MFKRWWFWAPACVLVVVIVLVVAITGAANNSSHGSSTSTTQAAAISSTPTTADLTAAAAQAYLNAYNKMIDAENPLIAEQNSGVPTTVADGINGRILVRDTFDQAVQAITFPVGASADAQKVLSADAALKDALGTLAANVDDTSNYNAVFSNVTSAESNFASANAALSNDLGLTTSGNTGSTSNS